MKITNEMVEALRDIVRHKVLMWDASTRLEALTGVEIDTNDNAINDIATGIDEPGDVYQSVDKREVAELLGMSEQEGFITPDSSAPEISPDDEKISVTWSVGDVLEIRPDLSTEQCKEILASVKQRHDAEIGINWEVIRTHANTMFGDSNDNSE